VNWLTSLPAAVLVVGSLVMAAAVAVGTRRLVVALVPVGDRDMVHTIAAPLMPALGAAFAVFTALALTSEAGYLRSAQDIVSHEAADASRLAWASTSPRVDTAAIQGALVEYLQTTRAREWRPVDQSEAADPAVTAAIGRLQRTVRAEAARKELGTPASTELLASVDAITQGRRARIAAADRQLPVLYVLTLVVSGIALVANAGALTVRASLRTSFLVTSLAAVVGLSLALLISLTGPWSGPLVVNGNPMDAVARDLRTGFFTAGG
jgi:hypothetical protein